VPPGHVPCNTTVDVFEVDDRIGNYRVEHAIGATKSGAIYQVVHEILPRRATIKVMHAAMTGVLPIALQVLREACLLEALRHPGVPRLYESGMLADRRPWFAFERIAGPTLADRLTRGPLAAHEVAAITRDLADTLEHAHRRGIVHRGLRPDRIVLSPDRVFGVAIVDWSDAHAHDAGTRIPHVAANTRQYVAPELARGDNRSHRIARSAEEQHPPFHTKRFRQTAACTMLTRSANSPKPS
jgi:serine/threonine protein kinase